MVAVKSLSFQAYLTMREWKTQVNTQNHVRMRQRGQNEWGTARQTFIHRHTQLHTRERFWPTLTSSPHTREGQRRNCVNWRMRRILGKSRNHLQAYSCTCYGNDGHPMTGIDLAHLHGQPDVRSIMSLFAGNQLLAF